MPPHTCQVLQLHPPTGPSEQPRKTSRAAAMICISDEESRPEWVGDCPKSHSQWVERSGLEPRSCDSYWRPCLLQSTAVRHNKGPYALKPKRGKMAKLGQAPQARLGARWGGQVSCRRLLLSHSISFTCATGTMRAKPRSSSLRPDTRHLSFLQPFNKSLLSTYHAPRPVPSVGDTDEGLGGPLPSKCAPSSRERHK